MRVADGLGETERADAVLRASRAANEVLDLTPALGADDAGKGAAGGTLVPCAPP